ncbi:MAG: hypothetical protein N2485_06450 [bacterium]|nr:hypothetical protein [bacterium]
MFKLVSFFLILLTYFFIYIFFLNSIKNHHNLVEGDYYSLTELPSFKNQVIMFNFYDGYKYNKQFYGRGNGKIKIIKDYLYLNESIITNKYFPNIKFFKIPYNNINIDLIYNLRLSKIISLKINGNTIKSENIVNYKIDILESKEDYIYFLLYSQGKILLKDNIYIEEFLLKLIFIRKN